MKSYDVSDEIGGKGAKQSMRIHYITVFMEKESECEFVLENITA